jgi:hypothetical protein
VVFLVVFFKKNHFILEKKSGFQFGKTTFEKLQILFCSNDFDKLHHL